MTPVAESASDESRSRAERALDFAQAQVRRLVTAHPDYFPLYTTGGMWRHERPTWTNWCEGFLPGMMWIFARRTGDAWWRERAEHYSRLIEDRQYDREVHDLGFLFWSSWKRWHDLSGDPAVRDVVIRAGQTMGLRFNEAGRYLRSFVAPESCFIDIMMNVGIIFYAARQTGDDALWRVATEHCLTTRRYLVRGDGSTSHEGIFDPATGAFLRQATHQGWRDDSSWARGQAWAIYGFGTAYGWTGDARFLRTARACADFYLDRTPDHGVPPNDWEEPNPLRPHESSAAAIAAGGFLQLGRLTADLDPVRAARYAHAGRSILDTLCGPAFLASETPGWEGILRHGSYHERLGLGVDESVMWGEYFLVEALDTLLNDPRGVNVAVRLGRRSEHAPPSPPSNEGKFALTKADHGYPVGDHAVSVVEAFIEIPRGSRNKYELDTATGRLRLDRVLYSSVHYPADYGFIPETLAPDGDPVDILVLVQEPTFPGCIVPARPIGGLDMYDEKGSDFKVVAVPVGDPRYAHVTSMADAGEHWAREIETFFATYKLLEDKTSEVIGWHTAEEAIATIESCRARYAGT